MAVPTEAERKRDALTAIRAGADNEEARQFAGFSASAWDRLMRGRFGKEVEQARAELGVFLVGKRRAAANTDPHLAGQLLDEQRSKADADRWNRIAAGG